MYCVYGDNLFKDYVPSDNTKQLLHQAMVIDLQYGVFVMAVLVDGESQIVKQVLI